MAMNGQRFFLLIIGLLFCVLGCTRERGDIRMLDDHPAHTETHESVDVEVAFEQNLLPILTARCALAGCHVADGPHGLDFRTYESFVAGGEHGPAFIPGNAGDSEIVEQIVEGNMPPPPRDPLTAAEIQLFKDWINQQEASDHVVQHDHGEEEGMAADHDEEDDHGAEEGIPADHGAEDGHGEEEGMPADHHEDEDHGDDAHDDENDDN